MTASILNRCEYCIDPCQNPNPTRCSSCNKREQCYRVLRPTIRITTKCTQRCAHCCFSCSSERTEMMSVDKAKEVAMFLSVNGIIHIQIMGGEFFMNPHWETIVSIITKGASSVRLVSNSDWAGDEKQAVSVIKFLKLHSNILVSLSFDKWHTNEHVEKASQLLKENNIPFNIGENEDSNENAIVPVGRANGLTFGFYSMFGCFCQNPTHKYGFLIDENGDIFKCGLGVWNYASVTEYLDGGFKKRFKELNSAFYDVFIPNCQSCVRGYHQAKYKVEKERKEQSL